MHGYIHCTAGSLIRADRICKLRILYGKIEAIGTAAISTLLTSL